MTITKPDLNGHGLSHPARFPLDIIPQFVNALQTVAAKNVIPNPINTVLDPFAGTGRIHLLQEFGYKTAGVELEPEWANLHHDTTVGDARFLSWIPTEFFDAIVTSPCYGNRLADSHDAKDGSVRRGYTHDLGRKLSPNNAGAMQWGDSYRVLHEQAWAEAFRVLRYGGAFVLNIKDHIRNGERQHVSGWHVSALSKLGFTLLWSEPVKTRNLKVGSNSELRAGDEMIYVFQKL